MHSASRLPKRRAAARTILARLGVIAARNVLKATLELLSAKMPNQLVIRFPISVEMVTALKIQDMISNANADLE